VPVTTPKEASWCNGRFECKTILGVR